MLNEVPPSSHGINLQYRVDGGLFDLARFRAKSKTSTITAHELQFSDDNATPAQPFDDLCRIATIYNVSYQHFGMEVNTDKTKVHIQPPPGQTLSRTNDGINGEHLGKVDYFPVLAAFSQKLQRVQRTLAIAWKLHTVHMGALVTGSSTTMRYPSAPKSWFSGPPFFLPFSMSVKLGPCTVVISNALTASNRENYDNCSTLDGSCDFQTMKSTSVLGCLVWKPLSSAGRDISYGWTPSDSLESCSTTNLMNFIEGIRAHGGPKLRYKDLLKCFLKQAGINPQSWEQLANDRSAWRRKTRDGVESFETARKQQDEDRRKWRHEKLNQTRPTPSIPCDHFPRLFHHRLGLQSHISHRHQPQVAKSW